MHILFKESASYRLVQYACFEVIRRDKYVLFSSLKINVGVVAVSIVGYSRLLLRFLWHCFHFLYLVLFYFEVSIRSAIP